MRPSRVISTRIYEQAPAIVRGGFGDLRSPDASPSPDIPDRGTSKLDSNGAAEGSLAVAVYPR